METQVLEENDATVGGAVDGLLDLGADTVVGEGDLLADELLELSDNGLQGVLGVDLAVGTAQVGHEDNSLGAIVDGVLDGGNGTGNALVVGDVLVGVERDVEVNLGYVRTRLELKLHAQEKHTRIKTRLPLRSTSEMESLLESDIVTERDLSEN